MSGPFRDGRVHVLSARCKTCIFRPGNPMRLVEGRVEEMVAEAVADQSAIVCHSTLYRDGVGEAVCYGFFRAHPTQPLQVAERLGYVVYDEEVQ